MTNEAVLKVRVDNPVDFVVDNATGIEKGALLTLADPRTASGSHAATSGAAFAGIAAREKIASDGVTRLAVFRRGIFDLHTASGAVTAGSLVELSGANTIRAMSSPNISAGVAPLGVALETAAAGTSETIEVMIGGY